MSRQTTLLTSHKGVDLHAASALLVMKDRLDGGDRLVNLLRCEMHTYWDESVPGGMDTLLNKGRYYNPNKHHFGHFMNQQSGAAWFDCDDCRGKTLESTWLGELAGTDMEGQETDAHALYEILLGGRPAKGISAVDVISFPLGQSGSVISGVVWRMLIDGDAASAVEVGHNLAVARGRKHGLLINPHMEAWLMAGTENR